MFRRFSSIATRHSGCGLRHSMRHSMRPDLFDNSHKQLRQYNVMSRFCKIMHVNRLQRIMLQLSLPYKKASLLVGCLWRVKSEVGIQGCRSSQRLP